MYPYVSASYFLLVAAILCGVLVQRRGAPFQLRYVFVAAVFMGLCGPGLLALSGVKPPRSYFLVPFLVDEVYQFCALCMVFFWVGYYGARYKVRQLSTSHQVDSVEPLPLSWILTLAALPFVFAVIRYGADAIFGVSSFARGENQVGFARQVHWTTYLYILSQALIFPVSVVSGVAWEQTRRRAYLLAPLLLSIDFIAQFSRGMALPFAVAFLGAGLFASRRRALWMLLAAILLIQTGLVLGLQMRGASKSVGLGQYSAAFEEETDSHYVDFSKRSWGESRVVELVRSTNALAVMTKVFEVGPKTEGHMTVGYILSQLPIPSFLLPANTPKTNLSFDLGFRKSGFPYPLMAELKVFFGSLGAVFLLVLGAACGLVDIQLGEQYRIRPYLLAIFYSLILFFIIRSFHSGLRSSLRPTLYFIGAWLMYTKVFRPFVLGSSTTRTP